METIRNSFIGIRQAIKRFYSLYGIYIDILVKLAVAYAAFSYMNQYFPGRSFLLRPIVTIAVALLCSVLPWNYITLISAFWLLLQVSAISLEVTVFLFIILLVLALLRYLLLPGVGIALVLLPLCFLWKIPFVIPVIVGLAGTVSGFITVGSGVLLYYSLRMVVGSMSYLTDPEAATLVQRLLFLTENTLKNETMLAVLITFALTTLVVYLISRTPVPYAPQIAVLAGAVFDPILLQAILKHFGRSDGPEDLVWGSIAAFFLGLLFSVLARVLDYAKTERVQFEDDEYYYYVKAVPKLSQPDEAEAEKQRTERRKQRMTEQLLLREAAENAEEKASGPRSRGNAERRSRSAQESAAAQTAETKEEAEEVTENA
ncbi:MAG: hypothetical protein J5496_01275 [Lachnospiraceae bacterium]|nr:hypothetical protein [Lachnospiraceae bacterium]